MLFFYLEGWIGTRYIAICDKILFLIENLVLDPDRDPHTRSLDPDPDSKNMDPKHSTFYHFPDYQRGPCGHSCEDRRDGIHAAQARQVPGGSLPAVRHDRQEQQRRGKDDIRETSSVLKAAFTWCANLFSNNYFEEPSHKVIRS